MQILSDNNLLRRALQINAIFSGFSAVLMFVSGRWLAMQFGLHGPGAIYAIGALLALFTLQLANIVTGRKIRAWEIKSIIGGDIAWVIGSVVLISFYYQSITAAGLRLVVIVAVAVLFIAILQIRGLQQFGRWSAGSTRPGQPVS